MSPSTDQSRSTVISNYRDRIQSSYSFRRKLLSDSQVIVLVDEFVCILEAADSTSINSLCHDELALLSEGHSLDYIVSNLLPIYLRAIQAAINSGSKHLQPAIQFFFAVDESAGEQSVLVPDEPELDPFHGITDPAKIYEQISDLQAKLQTMLKLSQVKSGLALNPGQPPLDGKNNTRFAQRRILATIEAAMVWNNTEGNKKYRINKMTIYRVVGCNKGGIDKVFDAYSISIADHNELHGFPRTTDQSYFYGGGANSNNHNGELIAFCLQALESVHGLALKA